MLASQEAIEEKTSPQREPIEWLEVPIFIHGISPDQFPSTGQREYNKLLSRVNEKLKGYAGKKFTGDPIFVTWGVPNEEQSVGSNQHLAELERKIQSKVKERMGNAYSNPFGMTGYIRDLLFFGVSDLFYYISADGEQDLRKQIFNTIAKCIRKMDKNKDGYFSLTLFGHSAGSVMAHDLLYHLFSDKEHKSEQGTMEDSMDSLRAMIEEGRLRIRRLYTFGSPISLLVLRASSLMKKFLEKEEEPYIPHNIGLMLGDNLSLPRWVNFWSRYDLVSYPVDFLYANAKGIIEDYEVSSSLNPKSAHTGYWTSDEMAEYIAKTF